MYNIYKQALKLFEEHMKYLDSLNEEAQKVDVTRAQTMMAIQSY